MPSKNPLLATATSVKANPLPKIGGSSTSNPLNTKSSTQVLAPPVSSPTKAK
jgi:hypothetical protein